MNMNYVGGLLSGLVGGVIGAIVVGGYANGSQDKNSMPARSVTNYSNEIISAKRIQLHDDKGRTRAEFAMSPDGGVGIFFYDTQGRSRLVLGLYSPAESEYPFVSLNDKNQASAGLIRLFGTQETPVVVLKNKGADVLSLA